MYRVLSLKWLYVMPEFISLLGGNLSFPLYASSLFIFVDKVCPSVQLDMLFLVNYKTNQNLVVTMK